MKALLWVTCPGGRVSLIGTDFIMQLVIAGLVAFLRNLRCSDAVCACTDGTGAIPSVFLCLLLLA